MQIYTVSVTHADLDGPYVVDLIASNADLAASRAIMSAVHIYRHAELMDATASVNPVMCAWFMDCDRPATCFTAHPVLHEVATCAQCHEFATK